jgi:hypothetical protein
MLPPAFAREEDERPRLTGINAVAGRRTMFRPPGIWKPTRQ